MALKPSAGDAADGVFIGRLPLERPGRGSEPHGSTPWFLRRMRAKSVLQMEKRPLPGPLLQETTRTASNRGLFFSRQALRPPRLPRRPTPPISPRPSFFRRRVDVSVRSRRLLWSEFSRPNRTIVVWIDTKMVSVAEARRWNSSRSGPSLPWPNACISAMRPSSSASPSRMSAAASSSSRTTSASRLCCATGAT